jgi:hypothetical protein
MKTAELLSIAQETLAAHASSRDEFVEKVAAYSAAFEAWGKENPDVLKGKVSAEADSLRALAEVHAKIIDFAEEIKRQTGRELGEQRKKGKGIMAYTDILPKRISMSGTKKGA